MKMFEDPPAAISHDAHPGHMLKLVNAAASSPFRCDGCKEPGSGKGRRYSCDDGGCEFDLHVSCALAEPTLKHPLLGDDLEFKLLRDGAPRRRRVTCAACGDTVLGSVYRCSKKGGLYIHPCCAALRTERVLQDEYHVQLCGEAKLRCVICGEKGQYMTFSTKKLWAYRWRYGGAEGYLHVACMKKIAVQSWEQAYLHDGGGVLEASVPIMKGVLQGRRSPGDENTVKSGELKLAVGGVKIASRIADVVSGASSSN